jgi:LysR family hydrogen peroxide-inducible transcriptional activator
MNFQQLDYIIAVDTHKHFGKAADSCYVTQATLSGMIKKLEDELGIIIFDRKSHPIITTDCGKDIIKHAKLIKMQTSLMKEADKLKNRISGIIQLGIIPTISSSLLPVISKKIFPKYPDLIINIHEYTTETIIEKLKTGDLDMAIVTTPLNHDEIEENILYYESFLVYNSESVLSNVQYITPETIKNQKVWLLEEGHCFREQFLNLCDLKQFSSFPTNFTFEAGSFDSLINMTDVFGGLTLIPELYAEYMSENKRKKLIAFKTPYPVREVSLVSYRKFSKLRVIESLREEITKTVLPFLRTSKMKNSEMYIVDI